MKDGCDITAANDGRVMVVERRDSCVHIFSEDGDYLEKLNSKDVAIVPELHFTS